MKMWRLMEAECHQLDLELAQLSTGEAGDRAAYSAYSRRIHQISELEEEKEKQEEYAGRLDSACTMIALRLGDDAEQSPLLRNLCEEYDTKNTCI